MGVVVAVVAVVLLASTAQGLTGFGFGLTAVPLFLLLLDVRDAVVLAVLLGLANVLLLAVRVWRDVPWRTVAWLSVGSFLGMPFGLAVLLYLPQDVLRLLVGVTAVSLAALLARGWHVEARGVWEELAVGLVSGVLRTSTSMAGPPVVLYLQGRGHPPAAFRGALTMYFLIGTLSSIGAFAGVRVVSPRTLMLAALSLPAVYLGNWLGNRLLRRVSPSRFRAIVLVLLGATALAAIATSAMRLV